MHTLHFLNSYLAGAPPQSRDLDDTISETLAKHVYDMDVPEMRSIISSVLAPSDALTGAVLLSFACQIQTTNNRHDVDFVAKRYSLLSILFLCKELILYLV